MKHDAINAALCVAVIAQLAWWIWLCVRVWAGRVSARFVQISVLAWSGASLFLPPLFSRDGWSYAAQGNMWADGLSPYQYGPGVDINRFLMHVDPLWRMTVAPYGPLPIVYGAGLSHVTQVPYLVVVGYRLMAIAGLVMLLWAVPRLARWTGMAPARALAISTASPLALVIGIWGLHNDMFMIGLMACALVVAVERGWLWGAVLGGLAASIKVPGGLVCIAVALVTLPAAATMAQRVWRLISVGAVAVAVLLGISEGSGLGLGWISALGVPGSITTPMSIPTAIGVYLDRMVAWNDPHVSLHVMRVLGLVLIAGAAIATALRGGTGDRVMALKLTALTFGLSSLFVPSVHIWYLLWALPFIASMRMSAFARQCLFVVVGSAGLIAKIEGTWSAFWILFSALGALTIWHVIGERWARENGLLPARFSLNPVVVDHEVIDSSDLTDTHVTH